VWQEVREELHPRGLEIVTVALEVRGLEKARRWIEAAKPQHPALIDQAHVMDERFGIVNVPSGMWVDEEGVIVRPPETAYPAIPDFTQQAMALVGSEDVDPYLVGVAQESLKIRIQPRRYMNAVRDWVANGAASRYALTPQQVTDRSRTRSPEAARAAAHFELAQHLHRSGHTDDAIEHFREAHRLQPENWTYKRQAWSMVDRNQGPNAVYDSDWLSEVRKVGAENYYERLDMPD
jgi:tetratricopeptide (TPR) repeat protein